MLEYETLTGEEIRKLIDEGKLERPDPIASDGRPPMPQTVSVPRAGRRFIAGDVSPGSPQPLGA